jgi:hypothetical protein
MDEAAFDKISELLKPSGRAIISVPYARIFTAHTWFRAYTREILNRKLSEYFNIIEQRFFKRQDGQWTEALSLSEDPASARNGVAVFLLSRRS